MNKKKIYSALIMTFLFSTFILSLKVKNLTQAKELSSNSKVLVEEKFEHNYEEIENKDLEYIKDLVCKNADRITQLVNKYNPLESTYEPDDLVILNMKSTKNNIYLSKCAADNLENMFNAAQREGIDLYLISGYRSSTYQDELYYKSLIKNGKEYTEKYIAKANYSEHQTGLAVDISSKSIRYNLTQNFENTIEGKWLAENSYKYGFILRYKKDRVEDTGYSFEPWHFRYVGYEIAKYIYENNLILEDLYD